MVTEVAVQSAAAGGEATADAVGPMAAGIGCSGTGGGSATPVAGVVAGAASAGWSAVVALMSPGIWEVASGTVMIPRAATVASICRSDCMMPATERFLTPRPVSAPGD